MGSYYWKPVRSRGRAPPQGRAAISPNSKKKGETAAPVILTGNAIASTFWGKAWCDNLERYSDYSNRLPRGRSS